MVSSDGSPSAITGELSKGDLEDYVVLIRLCTFDWKSLLDLKECVYQCSDKYLKDLISRDTFRQLAMAVDRPILVRDASDDAVLCVPLQKKQDVADRNGRQINLYPTLADFQCKVRECKDFLEPGMKIDVSLEAFFDCPLAEAVVNQLRAEGL